VKETGYEKKTMKPRHPGVEDMKERLKELSLADSPGHHMEMASAAARIKVEENGGPTHASFIACRLIRPGKKGKKNLCFCSVTQHLQLILRIG
jgi:hypothetical protein